MLRGALVVVAILLAACKDGGKSKLEDRRPARAPVQTSDAGPAPVMQSQLKLLGCAAAAAPPASLTAQTRAGEPSWPVVALGAMKVTGPHKKAEVAAALTKHMPRLLYCYEQRLVKQPTLAGSLDLAITVQPNGRVFEVIPSNSFDEELTLCLKHIVSEVKLAEAPGAKPDERSTVTQHLTFSWKPNPLPPGGSEPTQWTPFAAAAPAVPAVADAAASTFPATMTLATLEACLGTHNGSFRSIVKIGVDGAVVSARTGGLADKAAEECVSQKLVGLKLAQSAGGAAEVACDFQRGDATPWRISLDAGYTVIDLAAAAPLPAPGPALGEKTVVVVAAPKTTSQELQAALEVASHGAASLVAIRADEGAPIYVAAGPHAAIAQDPSAAIVLDTKDPLTVCGGMMPAPQSGPINQADVLLGAATRHCTHRPCPSELIITTAGSHNALDLAAFAGAARGVDLERVMLGTAHCDTK
jgi:hypothetical protein